MVDHRSVEMHVIVRPAELTLVGPIVVLVGVCFPFHPAVPKPISLVRVD